MAKDDTSSLILIVLGLGALVLMSNSSGSEKTKILQKRTKDIEKGVPKETAVQTNPLPAAHPFVVDGEKRGNR